MSYPPSLTWMHLLEREAPFATLRAPEWLQASINRWASPAQQNGHGEVVAASCIEDALRDHRDAGAIVKLNAPRRTAAELRKAGFEHVIRFAVLPNLREARWFIPLGSKRAAAASFSVYTPSRRSAILRRLVARVAARCGVGCWYSDEILIARKHLSPLELLLQRTLHTPSICIALSAGAPEGARNRKCSVAAVSPEGKLLAFAKIASGPLAEKLVANEHAVLQALATRDIAARGACVPEPVFGGDCAGSFTLVQRPLKGRPAGINLTAVHERFLRALIIGPSRPLLDSRLVQEVIGRAQGLGDRTAAIQPLLDEIVSRGANLSVPVAVVHGDFAPWNLLINDGLLGAFDWEYGHEDGVPLLDDTNHRLQVAHLIHDQSAEEAHSLLTALAATQTDFAPETARLLQSVAVLDVTTRLLAEGYGAENKMLDWYLALGKRLAEPVRQEALTS